MNCRSHLVHLCAKVFAAPELVRCRYIALLLCCCPVFAQNAQLFASAKSQPLPNASVVIADADVSGLTDDSAPSRINLNNGTPEVIFVFDKDASPVSDKEFRYRLVGYDSDWKNTRLHAVRYRQLIPGSYKFEVQEKTNGGGWLSHAVMVSIGEQPHLYQTWYFYLALSSLAIILPAYFYQRRVQLMKGRIGIVLEERNRIARECHDTLMAGFAAISWQLEATANLFRNSDLASTPAANSCELARSMVAHCQAEARRIIWDLRDADEVTNILSQALTRTLAANHMREAIETTLDVEGEEVPLPPGCIHHLVCIGQEAITNAVRHADPTQIDVHLKYESDSLSLLIRDNGRGFESADRTASKHGHFGIPVMEERARKLGAAFRLQTQVGIGTEVAVKMSFNMMHHRINQEHHVIRWIGI